MRLYILGITVLLVSGLFVLIRYQATMAANLQEELALERVKLSSCVASLNEASEDRKNDATIDAIPDNALRDAAREWLLENKAGGVTPIRP